MIEDDVQKLSERQFEYCLFFDKYINENDNFPTFSIAAQYFEVNVNAVQGMIKTLVKKGYLQRLDKQYTIRRTYLFKKMISEEDMQIETTIEEELYEWGWWMQDCPSRDLSYPSKANMAVVKSGGAANITEDRALQIDQAIAALFGKDSETVKIIKLRFGCGMSYRDISEAMHISKSKVNNIIDASVGWLDSYLRKNS